MSDSSDKLPPLPESLGPYSLVRQLGQGGMGVVYEVVHRETGDRAAVKMSRDSSAGLLSRFGTELRALARVRHPGVVRVLDHGYDRGRPWYAMELVEGSSLAEWSKSLWLDRRPEALGSGVLGDTLDPYVSQSQDTLTEEPTLSDELLTTAPQRSCPPSQPMVVPPARQVANGHLPEVLGAVRKLCEPLMLVHSLGIVHRDLKPDNVLLREDGAPVLVDFGLAGPQGGGADREVLRLERGVSGTVGFMAPEQVQRQELDARTDIYALGCILYLLLVGRMPFAGRPQEVIWAHVKCLPEEPSRRVTGVPKELDQLVLAMLEKDPRRRIGYVDDVARALDALGAPAPPATIAPSRQRPYLYRPRFVGRSLHLATAREALERASEGGGGVHVISGPSGVGKTRFVTHVAHEGLRAGWQVVTGECLLAGSALPGAVAPRASALRPLRPLLRTLRDRAEEWGPERTRELLGESGAVIAPFDPALAFLPGVNSWEPPPELPAPAARRRLYGALLDAATALARSEPLLLILDDLQWADELTLGFLEFLTPERVLDVPLFVLATSREEDPPPSLKHLFTLSHVSRHQLRPLDQEGTRRVAADALGVDAPPRTLVDSLHARSGGNPFRISECLRAAVARGALTRDDHGRWRLHSAASEGGDALPLPEEFDDILALRLADLPEDARAVLDLAAATGREFHPDVVRLAFGQRDEAFVDAIDTLISGHVIEPLDNDRHAFVHDGLRELPYRRLPSGRRTDLHRRIALATEHKFSGSDVYEDFHVSLGHHWSLAGEPARAMGHQRAAAHQALATYANEQAITLLQAARASSESLQALTSPSTRTADAVQIGEELGDVLTRMGEQDQAREAFAWAISSARELSPVQRARLHRKRGKTWEPHHRHDEALAEYAVAAELLDSVIAERGEEWTSEYIENHVDQAWAHYWRSRVPEMQHHIALAEPLLYRHGSPLQRARFHQAVVNHNHRRDRYAVQDDTLEHARLSLDATLDSGEVLPITFARFILGFCLVFHGDLDGAAKQLGAGLTQAEAIGDLTLRSRFSAYLLITNRLAGRLQRVEAQARECLAVAEASGINEYVGNAHANLAWAALRRQNPAAVAEHYNAAESAWERMPMPYPFQWTAILPMARVLLDRGDVSLAEELGQRLSVAPLQRLPETIYEPLSALQREDAPRDGTLIRRALAAASSLGYL